MLALAVMFAIDRIDLFGLSWQKQLETLGRSSLFVYWIHVELVYGYATWPIHNRLPLWAALAAYSLFSGLMYAAVLAKDRVRQWHPGLAGPGRVPTKEAI